MTLSRVLLSPRFWPLFVAQFCGVVNDNLFKNALAILVVFRLGDSAGIPAAQLVTLAAGLFILPYFLLSATAGLLADRRSRSDLAQMVKAAEIPIALVGGLGLVTGSVPLLLMMLFLLGCQATLFGPVKYAILPDLLPPEDLMDGNALIEAGTFLGILLGTIGGGVLVLLPGGPALVAGAMTLLAATGYWASRHLPALAAPADAPPVGLSLWRDTMAMLQQVRGSRTLTLVILGISWFWFFGATWLSQLPNYARDVLKTDEHSVTLMLTMFSLGIGLGSVLSGRLLRGVVSPRYVPLAAIGMTLLSFDLAWASGAIGGAAVDGAPVALAGLSSFIASGWRILLDLFLIAVCGGIYTVPLYTMLQTESGDADRARMVAANNIVNALFMVVSALLCGLLLAVGASVTGLFLVNAVITLGVAVYLINLLPDHLLRSLLEVLLRRLYRVEIHGLEHLAAAGNKVVLAVNHVSFLDAALLVAFLPVKPTFAINTHIAARWWVRPFLRLVDAYPMDPTNPMAIKGLIATVRQGRCCAIFPEGRITVTGALMKVYEGPGVIADLAGAALLPVRIDGAQFTPFSRLKKKLHLHWFPRITLTLLPPHPLDIDPALRGRRRREKIGAALYDVMSGMMFDTSDHERDLFDSLLKARALHGGRTPVLEDIRRAPLSFDRLLTGSLVLGRKLAPLAGPDGVVGLMLPNLAATAVAFFGLQAFGKVPAMLNFTAGAGGLKAACQAARITSIVTSRQFITQAKLEPLVAQLYDGGLVIQYLEDIRDSITLIDKLRGVAGRLLAGRVHRPYRHAAQDPAVILFTSGSEGTPKGVVLSHRNLLSNAQQVAARIDFSPADTVFNALPLFHSFGLTGGLLLPLLGGVRVFLYPSPLHYRIVPELVYDTNATILFGTDTFLSGYARVAHPYDFYSVRYVFAGAEKVKDATRAVWMEKFGLRLLEGYGATETAPVLAVNTPMHFRPGTTGRLLPGIEARLDPVPGIETGGRLLVRGPNVMLGYVKADAPGQLQPPPDGWYDTGDIVTIDDDGFVRIVGRMKRFAKLAGEMISLGTVEAAVEALWPDARHAVVTQPDPRKGEQLVLLTTQTDARRDALVSHFRARGLSELMLPRQIFTVPAIPLLGSGKPDYPAATKLAEMLLAGAGDAGTAAAEGV